MPTQKALVIPGRRVASPFKKLLKHDNIPFDTKDEIARRILCACQSCVSQLKTASEQYGSNQPIVMGKIATGFISSYPDHAITQKARGLLALVRHPLPGIHSPSDYETQISSRPVQAAQLECGIRPGIREAFVRPAPSQPWHGFKESKKHVFLGYSHPQMIDESIIAINNALAESRLLDPYSEVISMRPIDAEYSAIAVLESGVLVIGPGHDGATGGKNSITLQSEPVVFSELRKASRIRRKDDHSYIEIVYSQNSGGYQAHAVQCRPGEPIQGGSTEFVPEPVVVAKIIIPTDDLLAWRELTADVAGEPGVVAWAPNGSLACHAAIHCVTKGIPFLTRAEAPQLGDQIHPPDNSAPQSEFDIDEFAKGLASLRGRTSYRELLSTGIPMFHNIAYLKKEPCWSFALGTIAASFFRAAAAACFGEMRHIRAYLHGKARLGEFLENTILTDLFLRELSPVDAAYLKKLHPHDDISIHMPVFGREQIYERTADFTLRQIADKLAAISHHYLDAVWPKGFGGLNWFRSTVHTLRYYDAITSGNLETIMDATNVLLNCQHNGGWLFNKFIEQNVMNAAAKAPLLALACSGPFLYRMISSAPEANALLPDDVSPRDASRVAHSISFSEPAKSLSLGEERVQFTINNFKSLLLPWTKENKALMKEYFAHA